MNSPQSAFPLRLTGELDADVGRWLWLVKWLLAIPHFIVLVFLWIGFVLSTVVAGFAILFTGRYPRRIFDFNVGVLRWSWRVAFYSYSALGTDKYPPFSLGEEPAYPATFPCPPPTKLVAHLAKHPIPKAEAAMSVSVWPIEFPQPTAIPIADS